MEESSDRCIDQVTSRKSFSIDFAQRFMASNFKLSSFVDARSADVSIVSLKPEPICVASDMLESVSISFHTLAALHLLSADEHYK